MTDEDLDPARTRQRGAIVGLRTLTWDSITGGLPYADRMDDSDILARIREMVDAEHELRREMQEDPRGGD